jgi:hypothetical protein
MDHFGIRDVSIGHLLLSDGASGKPNLIEVLVSIFGHGVLLSRGRHAVASNYTKCHIKAAPFFREGREEASSPETMA